MRFLITGGAGFIGRHLVRRLLDDRANEVAVLDNLRRSQQMRDVDCLFVEGDIRDEAVLAAVMRGVDVVYHLAAQSNVMGACADLEYSFSTNVVGTVRVLSAAQAAGVRKVVFTSSREVYGDATDLPVAESAPVRPKNAYGASKLAGEEYCRVFSRGSLPVVVLRLANVYGPGDSGRVIPLFVSAVLRGEPILLYGGDQVIDFLWIEQAVQALIRAVHVNAAAGPFNLGSGTGTTVRQLAELIQHHIPTASPAVQLPPREHDVAAYVADIGKAVRYGLLDDPGQPLRHLDAVIESIRHDVEECAGALTNGKWAASGRNRSASSGWGGTGEPASSPNSTERQTVWRSCSEDHAC